MEEDYLELEELKPNKFLLNFSNKQNILENELNQDMHIEYKKDTQIIMILQFAIYLLKTLFTIIIRNKIPNFTRIFVLRMFLSLALLIILLFRDYLYQKNYLRNCSILIIIFILALKTFPNYNNSEEFENSINFNLEAIFNYLCFINLSHVNFTDIIGISIFLLISSLITNVSIGIFHVFDFLFLIYAIVFFLHSMFIRIRQRIDQFNNIRKKKLKKHAHNELIYQLLPLHVIINLSYLKKKKL